MVASVGCIYLSVVHGGGVVVVVVQRGEGHGGADGRAGRGGQPARRRGHAAAGGRRTLQYAWHPVLV